VLIMLVLAWKRPRLAARITGWFLALLAGPAVIAAPCRMYLRAVGAPVPFDALPAYDVAALFAGLLILAGLAVLLLERADRRKLSFNQA
jgi:hypothetical protein